MHNRMHRHHWDLHPAKSLAARGGLARTFGGLVTFLAVTFLCTGIYILDDAFENPLAAQAVTLIAAAVIIALATVLLYYVLKPRGRAGKQAAREWHRTASHPKQAFLEAVHTKPQNDANSQGLAYQRVYVDHSRIRP